MAKSTLQRLVDSGLEISEMSRQQAESVVRQLVKAGEVQRRDAEDLVQNLMDRGRRTSEKITERVEDELVKQIGWLSERVDRMEETVERLVDQLGGSATVSDKRPASGSKKKKTKKKPSGSKKKKKPSGSKKNNGEVAPSGSAPVGPSGVRRVPTTRASRDAG